jgi:branched-subunit amino acid transport protein
MNFWLIVIASGLVTYAIRLSFLAGADRLHLSPIWRRALRFVPIAVLTALIVPDLLFREGIFSLSLDNHRLIASMIAIAVAWRTGNTLLTIGAGMAALLALQRLF